jgi:hypothetical protein
MQTCCHSNTYGLTSQWASKINLLLMIVVDWNSRTSLLSIASILFRLCHSYRHADFSISITNRSRSMKKNNYQNTMFTCEEMTTMCFFIQYENSLSRLRATNPLFTRGRRRTRGSKCTNAQSSQYNSNSWSCPT